MNRYYVSFSMALFAALASLAHSAEIDFQRDLLPLLREHCVDCHGPDTAESSLRLDSAVAALRGGNSGERVIVPGAADKSYLFELVTSSNPEHRMPPDADPLTSEQIGLLRKWIEQSNGWQGAVIELASQQIEHWSYQTLKRPPVPELGAAHPIDAFIQAGLTDAGLSMSEAATRARLIRRLYLVMHGLPPTPQQVQQFVGDQRGDAWALLVDEVLNSPRYGERWAMHWLDLVRFGETHGFETNRERPTAYHYRDWVIDAFNEDKPYDQFIIQQIAGDAVGADLATGFLVAGPYDLVKGQDPQLRLIQRQDELADIINTTGTAFLGLTVGCARCHNHKFDPISQTDFYAMQAVFAGVNHSERALPLPNETKDKLVALDREISELKQSLAKFIRQPTEQGQTETVSTKPRPAVNAKRNVEQFAPVDARYVRFTINATNGAQPCLDELEILAGDANVGLASAGAKPSSSGDFVHPLHKLEHINDGQHGNPRSWIAAKNKGGWIQIELPKTIKIDQIVWGRDREGRYKDRLAIDYRIETSLDRKDWHLVGSSANRLPFQATAPTAPDYDFASQPEGEAIRGRGLLARLQELTQLREPLAKPTMVYAGTFSQPGPTHRLYRGELGSPREQVVPAAIAALKDLRLPGDSPEQQRRLAIAHWIADKRNPLTARVMVNRLWQFHFGTGIVDTPSDFGGNGTAPTHPELLDWLASEFIDSGWSIKQIHRRILTSATWQQDSRPRPEALAVDASTRLLWRFPPRRLEAEAIRDCILAVTGKLDLRMGGPGFSAFEVEQENVRHYFPKSKYGPEDWRRMIYMTKVRQERDSVFGVFDCPDASQVTPQRSRSTTPLQALNLLNSRFVMQQADFLVERLVAENESSEARVTRAYQWCFGRDPEPDELIAAIDFIEQTGWQQFARAMLNANEFVFIP